MSAMTRLTEEKKKYLKYQIYNHMYGNPWISYKKIANLTNHLVTTVRRYALIAQKDEVIHSPSLILHPNPERRAALLSCKDKWKTYNELRKHPGTYYLSIYQGDWDIMIAHNRSLDLSEISSLAEVMVEGIRGIVFTPKVRYRSWGESIQRIEYLLEHEEFEKSNFPDQLCYPDWDEEGWKMYDYFKRDLRKRFNTLRKETPISWKKYLNWKKDLKDFCTVLIGYFPEGYNHYDYLTVCFKTDCEKFIAELLSNLPTTCAFYKIEKYLLVNICIPKEYKKQMEIFKIMSWLADQNALREYMDGNPIVNWKREIKR